MTTEHLDSRLRPRRKPRQLRSELTRARILDAAREVFAANGYAGGTTNHIAAEAGMSVGSLYQYFPNKDAILVELVNLHVDEGTVALAEAIAGFDDATDVELDGLVRGVVTAMVDLHSDRRRLHQVLFEESPRPPVLLDRLRDLESVAVAAFCEILAAAGVGGPDIEVKSRVVVVTVESLVHRLVATPDTDALDTDTVIDEVTRLITAYLVL